MWRAVEPADLPITALPDSVTDWDDLRGRLDTVLCALCADVPTLPGRFMLRLRSLSDPIFEVSAWNHHNTLGIEIPATISNTPSDHYTARGWMLQGNVWRQWFDKARFRHQNVAAATERLVETLSASQMAPTGLVYHGYIDACDRMLRLDLPELGITRDDRDGREIA